MSYTIIFETKIVELKDGRIIHFDRSGCNNDDAGRNKGDFHGKIYTKEEFIKHAESFIDENETDGFELKIGSKYSTYSDYGKHLLRMLKRATNFDSLKDGRYFCASKVTGIQLYSPEEKILSCDEFEKISSSLLYGDKPFSYSRLTINLYNEDEIVQALDNKERLSFYIGTKYKNRF